MVACAEALSPLRFAGSKARCLEALDAHFAGLGLQPGGFVYYEPMCGGLTVGLHILSKYKPSEAYLADASPDIINFFTALRSHHAALAAQIRELAGAGLDEHAYYALRRRFNEKRDCPLEAAAQFYLLNRGCFNGVYRVNGRGEFNVPFGRFRDGLCVVTPQHWAQLHRAHRVLSSAGVHLECVDVEHFLERHRDCARRDLLYADPPYVGTDRSLYHPRELFDLDKHRRVLAALGRWRAAGARLVANNANADVVRAMYAGWHITPLTSKRSVSACAESRGEGCHELLLTSTSPSPAPAVDPCPVA